MVVEKPIGYENELSSYQAILFDSWCGEAVAWRFKIIKYLGEERFNDLHQYGELVYTDLDWAIVMKSLTRLDAKEKYGEITEEIFGPKGGWKSVTFGDKKFCSKHLKV